MATTRERVIALVKQHPHLNQTEIAERVGASRQRVAQIVADEQLGVPRGPRGVASRRRAAEARAQEPPSPEGIPAYLAGAGGPVSVLVAAADLMVRGYTVYLPIAPTSTVDLVAIDPSGRVERVGVQKARRAGDDVMYEIPPRGSVDRRALILTDEPVRYEPSFDANAR